VALKLAFVADNLLHGQHIRNRQLRIKRCNLLLYGNRKGYRVGIGNRAYHQRPIRIAAGERRKIHSWPRGRIYLMQSVGHHTDDLVFRIVPQQNLQMLPNGIFPWEELAREDAVDDDLVAAVGIGRVRYVLSRKKAPAQQWNLQGIEVSGIGPPDQRVEQLSSSLLRRMFGNCEDVILHFSRARHSFSQPYGAHTGHGG
jgi:hypothetical protein